MSYGVGMRFMAVIMAFFVASPVLAEQARLRSATQSEIRQKLAGAAGLKTAPDGYQYKPGGRIGYKILDGKVCIRGGASSCVDVYSDGNRLEMIDSRGRREFLN